MDDQGNAEPSTSKGKKRKPYITSDCAKVSRQTMYNWRKKSMCKKAQQERNVPEIFISTDLPDEPNRTDSHLPRPSDVPVSDEPSDVPVSDENRPGDGDRIEEGIECSVEDPSDDGFSSVGLNEFLFPEREDSDENFEEGKKLYSGSNITVGECVQLILLFFIKHSINKEALKGLLELITLLLPKPNNFPGTLYHLNKILLEVTSNYVVKKHFYCSYCTSYIDCQGLESDNLTENLFCSNCETVRPSPGVFVEFPLENVLRSLFEDRGMHRFYDDEPCTWKNLYSLGSKYNDLKSSVLPEKYDVMCAWNTDGVPVFKSNDLQLWPIQIEILDIPPLVRHLYVSVCGLWVGNSKPNMNTFLKPFCTSLKSLLKDGFSWIHPIFKTVCKSKVLAPLSIIDAPARALVLNMNQFNGKYGCSTCKAKGEVVKRGRGRARIYKEIDADLRTDEEFRLLGNQAVEKNSPVFGIKGPSWVSVIPHLDLSCSFSPDYMHCVLLGVVRHFLFQWMDSSNHNEPWYLGNKVGVLDRRLLSVKPPSFIQRLPRSLTKRKHWKAAEFRSWLLFYSLPVLNGVMVEKYFQHWMMLVHSIYILLKTSISDEQIEFVSVMLRIFVLEIQELYNENVSCTFNSHQLLHLSLFCKNWGPLWVSSAFSFESNNGILLRLIHGSGSVSAQLVNTLRFMNGMWYFSSKYGAKAFRPSTHSVKVIGVEMKNPLSEITDNFLLPILSSYLDSGHKVFKRVTWMNEIYTCKLYKRQTKYNNYTVIVQGRYKFCEIECFFTIDESVFCLVRALNVTGCTFVHKATSTHIEHLFPVKSTNMMFVIPFQNVIGKVIVVNDYLCLRPNRVENTL